MRQTPNMDPIDSDNDEDFDRIARLMRRCADAMERGNDLVAGGMIPVVLLRDGADQVERWREVAKQCDVRACQEKSKRHASEEKMGAEIERLRADLDSERAVLAMTVARLGGYVEGRPTSRLNFLQRIDELRRIEASVLEGE